MAFQNKGRRTPFRPKQTAKSAGSPQVLKLEVRVRQVLNQKPGRRNRRFAPACHRFLVLLLLKVRASRLRTLLLQ